MDDLNLGNLKLLAARIGRLLTLRNRIVLTNGGIQQTGSRTDC
jgi:hypothetical protein